MLHNIQRSIIEQLGFDESLRYGQLKPSQLDGNVFGYHLKQTIIDGYTVKLDDGSYALAPRGRDFFVRRFEDQTKSAHSIYLVVIKSKKGYLLRRRKVQPLIGKVGFLHGEPTPNMPVVEAATARLESKTGLRVELEVTSSALIKQSRNNELISYSHAIVLYGETEQEITRAGDDTGDNFWQTSLTGTDVLPSCHAIVDMLKSSAAWSELSYDL